MDDRGAAFGPELAAEGGLTYVVAGSDGYRRVRRGKGFAYIDVRGKPVNGPVREHIQSLVIPPAWEGVWIGKDQRGHILATGVDAAGRKQYIYHPRWEEIRDEVKFDRLAPLAERLPRLRKSVDADLRRRGLPRQKVVALAVAVLDRTLIRVGNSRYALENDSYGLTTLTCEHIEVDGMHVHLEFTAKGGAEQQLALRDRRLSRLIADCQELSGQTLFSYQAPGGATASIRSTDVNEYLASVTGLSLTAKDIRTWGASAVVTEELALSFRTGHSSDAVLAAVDVAAERLGNTREVCRSSYVHPAVIRSYEEGEMGDVWRRARSGKWVERSESALRSILRSA